jgi:hypothetical protein
MRVKEGNKNRVGVYHLTRNRTIASSILMGQCRNGGDGKTKKGKEKKGFLGDTIDVRIHGAQRQTGT